MTYTVDLRQKPEQEEPAIPLLEAPHEHHSVSWTTSLSKIPAKKTAVLVLMIAIAGGIAAMLLDRNFLFATLLFLVGFVMTLSSHQKPVSHRIEVDLAGITLHDQRYPYHQIKSFWIQYEPPHVKELSIELKKTFASYIKIPLEDANPLHIRERIIGAVPEKRHEDSVLDQVVRRLGL